MQTESEGERESGDGEPYRPDVYCVKLLEASLNLLFLNPVRATQALACAKRGPVSPDDG